MTELATVLERFNRKERNLLIRSVLGHKETPLRLSRAFRETLAEKLEISALPETTWWATDYHLNWIAGALAVHLNDNIAMKFGRKNPVSGNRQLIEGSQEDIDLLIAAGQQLIMVEVKAYGAWSAEQVASKLQRLDLLIAYCKEIEQVKNQFDFRLVLMSPREPKLLPQKLEEKMPPRLKKLWPEIPWIPFKLETSIFQVTRCLPDGHSSAAGTNWCVLTKEYDFTKED